MKFTKSEMKRSLFSSLTLLEKETDFVWATFEEIGPFVAKGYVIVNEQKREHYSRMKGDGHGKAEKRR